MGGWTALKVGDRTAVLAVGVVAGFAIGLAFHPDTAPAPGAAMPIAAARTAPAGPAPATAPELAGLSPAAVRRVAVSRGLVRIGVFGDSFGTGIWDGLYHQLPKKDGFAVLRFSKEATGFTRYRQLNLEDRARKQVADDPIDVAVISFGANDVQPIFAEGHLHALMDAGWQRIIGERIDRFVAVARSTGATVVWVGLPIMRDAGLDASVQQMDAFYVGRLARLHVPYMDTRPASLDPKGQWNAHLADPVTGKMRLVRQPDGIHMTGIGYQRLTLPLAARLSAYAGRLRQAAGVTWTPPAKDAE